MFEDLFTRAATISEYRSLPMLDERLRYLCHCKKHGAPRYTLRAIAFNQRYLIDVLGWSDETAQIDYSQVEVAAREWAQPRSHRQYRHAAPRKIRDFMNCSLRWLRFMDRLTELPTPAHHCQEQIGEFESWMERECGYSQQTIAFTARVAKHLVDGLAKRSITLDAADIGQIEQILANDQSVSQRSALTNLGYVSRLRVFFRFAEQKGWCKSGISKGLASPRHYPRETAPKGLDRKEINDLLATTEGDSPSKVRDRAILMILITYGLRAGEVGALKLDDVDWHNDTLRVFCPKTGAIQHFPLSASVGESIVQYLRCARFPSPNRNVFLTLHSPCRPLDGKVLSAIVARRMKEAGISGRRNGTHALRHAAAQHLLDHGFSMKAVGDYLGHRSVTTTSIYAKVDLKTLREVVETNLEVLQ